MRNKHHITEERNERKLSRSVLETSGIGDSLAEFNELRNEFKFVKDLNSMAVQASAERGWLAISRFYENCQSKKPGKKGFPRFQKDNRSVEYKSS